MCIRDRPGITKLIALQICREHHIPFEERSFTIEELMDADEVIVTDSKTEICPVIQMNDTIIGNGVRGPITEQLDREYKNRIIRQCGKVT